MGGGGSAQHDDAARDGRPAAEDATATRQPMAIDHAPRTDDTAAADGVASRSPWFAVVDALSVLGRGAVLLWRHWPVLLALLLAGYVLRYLLIRAAAAASAASGVLDMMVLVLAPLALMTAMVLMFRVLARSLPTVSAGRQAEVVAAAQDAERVATQDAEPPGEPAATARPEPPDEPAATARPEPPGAEPPDAEPPASEPRRRPGLAALKQTIARMNLVSTLAQIGSVLVPFLTLYYTAGYLKQDVTDYVNAVLNDAIWSNPHLFTDPGSIDTASRLPFSVSVAGGIVVATAFVLRKAIERVRARRPLVALSFVAAYAEVLWMTGAATVLSNVKEAVTTWIKTRAVVHWVQDTWQAILDHLGPLVPAATAVAHWIGSLFAHASATVLIPVAWLTTGAVVYGQLIGAGDKHAGHRGPRFVVQLWRRWGALDQRVRQAGEEATEQLRGRFASLWSGLRLLSRAGLVPMALFCLSFIGVQAGTDWIWELERALIGPRDVSTVWRPLLPVLDLVNQALVTLPLICLVAAGVDRVLATAGRRDASDAGDINDTDDEAVDDTEDGAVDDTAEDTPAVPRPA